MIQPPRITGEILARNTILNFSGLTATVLVGLLTIPWILHGLGNDRFGLLSLAWILLGYFSVFDLGIGRATTKYTAELLARGETKRVSEVLWSAAAIQGASGFLGALLLFALAPALVDGVLKIPAPLREEARETFRVLTWGIPVVLISTSFSGVLEAAQRFKIVNLVKSGSGAVVFLIPLVGVSSGWGLPAILGGILLCRGLATGIFFWAVLRICPETRKISLSFQGSLALLRYGGWVMITALLAPLLVYADRFLIGSLVSIAAVTFYTAPYEAVTRLWIIPHALCLTLFPAFSALGALESRRSIAVLFARSLKYMILALSPAVVVLIFFAPEILGIWLGEPFPVQSSTALQILAAGVFINSLAQIPAALLQGIGRPDIPAKFHLLETPLYLGLAWVAIWRWGIAGAAAAWAVRVSLDALLLYLGTFRVCRFRLDLLTAMELKVLMPLVVVMGVLVCGARTAFADALVSVQLPVCSAILFFFAWFSWKKLLTPQDRGFLLQAIQRFRG